MQDNKLSDKQLKFIDAYFKEQSINDVCKKLNITRATYYNYLNDDAVKEEISKNRYNLISSTTDYLQSSLNECCKVLMDIIKSDSTSPQIKINAINSIFSNCTKLTEQLDILDKIKTLEDKISYESALKELSSKTEY